MMTFAAMVIIEFTECFCNAMVARPGKIFVLQNFFNIQYLFTSLYMYILHVRTAPGPPTNVEVVRRADQLIVSWEPPTSPNGVIQSKHIPL